MTTYHRATALSVSLWVAVLTGGCALFDPQAWKPQTEEPTRPARTEPVPSYDDGTAATPPANATGPQMWVGQAGTIGTRAYVQRRSLHVRGYGLVIGLDGKGTSNCPRSVSSYLQKEIQRAQLKSPGGTPRVDPLMLIKSEDTAPVLVEGDIPAVVVRGARFDVTVRALTPEVKSLAGGVLVPCTMRYTATANPSDMVEGRIVARAGGRIFTNPFARGDRADSDPRRGLVLGGGVNDQDRVIQLISTTESYSLVRRMMRIINTRFGADLKTADGISPTTIRLTIPPKFRGQEDRFVDLVLHLPLADATSAVEYRAKVLVEELTRPNAPYEDTALCLEAIGTTVIPLVQSLYTHRQRATSFYAARVGARLGDDAAVDVLARHAEEEGPLRFAAIRELGLTPSSRRAGLALRPLLDDPDLRVRIDAYESLRRQDDPCIRSIPVGYDNFVLDVVDCRGSGLIYARRVEDRRIAVFGPSLGCVGPVFYSPQDRPLTVSADKAEDHVVLVRKDEGGLRVWDPMQSTRSVADLILRLGGAPEKDAQNQLEGLGIDYAVVLDLLSELCEVGTIPAVFRMERADTTDLLGPPEPTIRPESSEL